MLSKLGTEKKLGQNMSVFFRSESLSSRKMPVSKLDDRSKQILPQTVFSLGSQRFEFPVVFEHSIRSRLKAEKKQCL